MSKPRRKYRTIGDDEFGKHRVLVVYLNRAYFRTTPVEPDAIICGGECDKLHPHPLAHVEHVIEIRTQRKVRDIHWDDCTAPVGKLCAMTTKDKKCGPSEINLGVKSGHKGGYIESCANVTREVWIDGTRWGVLKGLE